MTFWHPFYTTFSDHTQKMKILSFRSPSKISTQSIWILFPYPSKTLKTTFKLYIVRCTQTNMQMLKKWHMHLLPILTAIHTWDFVQNEENLWNFVLNVQYIHMLGNISRAPFNKLTPIYIVRQCICFTLIQLFHQIYFKTKIPKTPNLYYFTGVPPEMHPGQMSKVCPNFHLNTL